MIYAVLTDPALTTTGSTWRLLGCLVALAVAFPAGASVTSMLRYRIPHQYR